MEQVHAVYERLRAGAERLRATSARERIQRLDALYAELLRRREDLQAAVYADFRKPAVEFDITELYVIKAEIRTVKRRLAEWMRERPVAGSLATFGARTWVRPEPKGATLILAPWNYPVQLALRPLVSAIAAGCSAAIKPSELTPRTAQVLTEIIEAACAPDEVVCLPGGVEVAQALLAQPWNHIYFTGSPAVGKLVMAAAARIPCSVTLELGGKSPVFVLPDARISEVAETLAWAKTANAGQICVAPDYVLVHSSQRDALVDAVAAAIARLYPDGTQSPDYQNIVAPHHATRLRSAIDEAVAGGARLAYTAPGGETGPCSVAPTVLTDLPPGCSLLEEEIFGPVLPVVTYTDLDEAVAFVRARPIPLALYIFGRSRRSIRSILSRVPSGNASINAAVVHVSSTSLPFGGLGPSGIGSGHGRYGFDEFTHSRGMYQQVLPGAAGLLRPPYTPARRKLADFLLRWT